MPRGSTPLPARPYPRLRIVDGGIGEALHREAHGRAMQIDEPLRFESPPGHGDPSRPGAGELVKPAEGKEHVLEGIEREFLGDGAGARSVAPHQPKCSASIQ